MFVERVSKSNNPAELLDSYAIFGEKKLANYHKLVRLHRLAEHLAGMYAAIKENKNVSIIDEQAEKLAKKLKMDTKSIDISFELDEIKGYFESIQATEYYDELERIQTEFQNLAAM